MLVCISTIFSVVSLSHWVGDCSWIIPNSLGNLDIVQPGESWKSICLLKWQKARGFQGPQPESLPWIQEHVSFLISLQALASCQHPKQTGAQHPGIDAPTTLTLAQCGEILTGRSELSFHSAHLVAGGHQKAKAAAQCKINASQGFLPLIIKSLQQGANSPGTAQIGLKGFPTAF